MTPVPGQAHFAQDADLGVGDKTGLPIGLGVRRPRRHPDDGHLNDLMPELAQRTSVGLRQENTGQSVVDQRTHKGLEPAAVRVAAEGARNGSTRSDMIDGVVDDLGFELCDGRKALVEVALGEACSRAHPAHAEGSRAV